MSSDDGEKGTVENLGLPSPEIEPAIGPEIERETETAAEEKEQLNLGDDRQKVPEESDKATVRTTESETQILLAEDDDGFKTPTSADHRIPPVTECPWAPRKPRPSPSKRKAPTRAFRRLQFDTSPEIESIFRPIEDNSEEPKVKRARRDDEESS